MFSNIRGLHPLDASGTSTSFPVGTTPDLSRCCLGRKMTRAESCEQAEGFQWDGEPLKDFSAGQ